VLGESKKKKGQDEKIAPVLFLFNFYLKKSLTLHSLKNRKNNKNMP